MAGGYEGYTDTVRGGEIKVEVEVEDEIDYFLSYSWIIINFVR